MDKRFTLCQGISVKGTEKFFSQYKQTENGLSGILSREDIIPTAKAFVESLKEPVFFFLELPKEDEEGYDVYYLDNCTKEVAKAIIKRYGQLLADDGVSKFGFGSHADDEEIYFQEYQEFSVYSKSPNKVEMIMKKSGVRKADKINSMWDLFSDENPGCLSMVELDGETVFDIPVNLESVGMYKFESE